MRARACVNLHNVIVIVHRRFVFPPISRKSLIRLKFNRVARFGGTMREFLKFNSEIHVVTY